MLNQFPHRGQVTPQSAMLLPFNVAKLDEIIVKNSAEFEGFQACKERHLETSKQK